MRVLLVDKDRRNEWDDFVSLEPSFSLFQTWEWGEFKQDFGWEPFRIAVEDQGRFVCAAQLFVKHLPLGLAGLAYIPRGPVGDWISEEPRALLFNEIHRLSRQHRAVFLKIEPSRLNDAGIDSLLRQEGFLANPDTNQPRASLTLDLTRSLDEILAGLRKQTRMYIRSAAQKGVTIRLGQREDLPAFYSLMSETAKRGEFPARIYKYYEQEWLTFHASGQAALLMAFYQDELLAVRIVYRFGRYAATFHSASSQAHAQLRSNNLLAWEGIKWARENGCETYDLWGIPDEIGQAAYEGQILPELERTDGLWGVYRFKSGFSKNVVYFLGAYDYIYNHPLYRLVTNRILNARTLEKISTWMDALGNR